MKMVKSLILGSAAGLIAMSGAQAADLPVKAKAVEYVRICSLYGAGFYYIPGTDTCIQLSGYLRVDLAVNTNSVYTGNTSGAGGAKNRFSNAYTWRSRQGLNIDTRTATEYGVLRTYFAGTLTWTSGSFAGNAAGFGTTYSGDGVAGGFLGVYYAFIQFAGFTMGKAVSQFSAPWVSYPGNNFDGLVGGGGSVTGVNQFTYTAQFGNGVSASISAQDQTGYYQAGVMNVGTAGVFGTGAYGANSYAGTGTPDIVGQLRVDQAWGLFQLSAAAHNNHAAYYGGPGVVFSGTELAGHPSDKWGWAVQAALSIKNIPTGPGDTINVQAVYTDGATRYNIQDLAGSAGAPTLYGSSGVAYQGVAIGLAPDTVFATGGSQQLVRTWGMRGAYTHNWNPYWNSAIYGAYAQVNYSGGAKALICGVGGAAGSFQTTLGAGVTTCNPDYNIAQLGLITRWTPVKGLTFSGDFNWTRIDQKHVGFINAGSAALGKPSLVAGYELKDQDNYQLLLRAQRNW